MRGGGAGPRDTRDETRSEAMSKPLHRVRWPPSLDHWRCEAPEQCNAITGDVLGDVITGGSDGAAFSPRVPCSTSSTPAPATCTGVCRSTHGTTLAAGVVVVVPPVVKHRRSMATTLESFTAFPSLLFCRWRACSTVVPIPAFTASVSRANIGFSEAFSPRRQGWYV